MRRSIAFLSLTCALACALGAPSAARAEQGRATISRVTFRSSPAEPWLMMPLFSDTTTTVSCGFDVRGLAPGTKISVDWRRAGQVLATTELVTSRDTRALSADLVVESPLAAGTYEVEIRVGGHVEATSTFRVAGVDAATLPPPRPATPRVFDLTLSADECVPAPSAPRAAAPPTFSGGVAAVQLCLQYENIPEGQRLVVRWYLSSSRQPLSETTYQPSGSGELSDAYAYSEGPIPPGAYHATVLLGAREVGRARFVIQP
jgi:hypothetical protein